MVIITDFSEFLSKIKIAVGKGKNNFTMKRGSFKYRRLTYEKTWLKLAGIRENGLLFRHPETNREYELRAVDENGRWKFSLLCTETEHNCFWVSFPAYNDERIYGCGETYSKLNLKGEVVRIWVAEHQNALRISKKMIKWKLFGKKPERCQSFHKYESYYAQPTFSSSKCYYVHADTDTYSEFDFSKPDVTVLYTQQPPVLYVEYAADFTDLSEKLSELLGRQKELPSWIYDGSVLAIQGGWEKIHEKIKKARAEGVRICGIWSQDWCGFRQTGFGYQVMWNWKFDDNLYKNYVSEISELRKAGIRFLGYINPFIALEGNIYKTAKKNNYCVKNKDGGDYLVTITTFPAAMVDFTNPEAYEWYKSLIKENMIGVGMSGWMADFGEYLPPDCVLHSGENPEKMHNRWPAVWAKMNMEAIRECGKEDEVFFFTRSGHTETVKYSPFMWTGDQHVDWSVDDGMPSVIPATLSLAMSGYGITHSDAGGYTTVMQMTRSAELLMRWEEMNAFSPLLRTHEGNQPQRNAQFDDSRNLLQHLYRMTDVHYKLKDYFTECVKQQAERGTPVMRPLFYHYDEEPAYDEMTEYLLGRDILVAPILTEGADSRRVYLPDDKWVHFFTHTEYGGGVFEVDAPIGCPPVFIRKESSYINLLM